MTREAGRMVRGEFRAWQPPAPSRYCLAICYCGECDHYQAAYTPTIRPEKQKPVRLTDKKVWLVHYVNWVRALPVGKEFTTAEAHGKIPDPPHHNHWGSAQTHVARLGLARPVIAQRSALETTKASLVNRWERIDETARGAA